MFFEVDIINVLIATIAVINALYGLAVFSRNRKNTTNQAFFFLTVVVSSWGIAMLFLRSASGELAGIWAARALYATAALIPFASVYFASLFPVEKGVLSFSQKTLVPLPLLFVLILTLAPNGGMIQSVTLSTSEEPVIGFNLFQHTLYSLYIIGYFSWVYVILFTKFFRAKNVLKIQLAYILIGTLTTTGIAVVTNLLLPYFGVFSLNWFGQIGILAMITFILYSILKHHLFNISVIATEVFVIVLQLTLFTQIFIAQTLQERLLAVGIFVGSFVIGILLVRSVIREVEARQHIEKLATDLRTANDRLKELDKLKSQFLSIASHDLRAPLTAIRNFLSLLIDGTYGKIPAAADEGMRQVFDRATSMSEMVDNYLNVSRIEQGRMKYDFAQIDFAKLLTEAIEPFKSVATEKGLSLTFKLDPTSSTLLMKADEGKLREVIENLVNNAINYTQKGSVTVSASKEGNKVRVVFKDTGVGMTEETQKGLFKLFSSGEDARKINPKSTGVGLYITKAHVEAHKGTIRAESAGAGQGSTFTIELPLSQNRTA